MPFTKASQFAGSGTNDTRTPTLLERERLITASGQDISALRRRAEALYWDEN
jgi:hypothetical protein